MKHIFISLILAAAAIAGLHAETYSINVGEFNRLKVIDGVNVDYHCSSDSAGIVTFECADPQAASFIGMSNRDQELSISYTTTGTTHPNLPTVKVYSSFLTKVENSGDSLVRVMSVVPCPNFSVSQIGNGRVVVRDISATRVRAKINTGNGNVVLYGKCTEAVLNMTGTGILQADGLEAATVKVSAYGTGSVGCWARELLKIHGIGSTKIYYKGEPAVRNRAVGVKVESIK